MKSSSNPLLFIRRGESETLELKRSTAELKAGVVSVAAILNKRQEGRLYFGVRNDGAIVGQDISEQTLRDVSRALSEGIEPRIYPRVKRVRLKGKDCIQVKFSGGDIPYLAYGRGYTRVGEEDRQLSARELERMFLERNRNASRWESEPSDRKLPDIDEAALRRLVKKANIAGRIDFEFSNVKATLNKLGLIKLNSMCHRDFRAPKGNEVAIFKDRVEIYNPGDFPEGYKPEDFIKGEERSILRNPLIGSVLFKSKDSPSKGIRLLAATPWLEHRRRRRMAAPL